ncbi:MAG: hypothetical protein P4L84_30125 [Isosphaeraceae bacterium]|nr:hypothetical protein [Isosphaeraceae bacterium]
MLRLTLRTLLAWLDDTLSPSEVREIGKQVGESPVGKELVERIQRVTRQRRLTVPSSSGADATDPNLVASYLDSELDPESVADFEKKCLTSDVHLAEVASVHQILSLIGQKAKVPPEARYRMYQLVKGRESIAPKIRRTARAHTPPPEPVSEPVQPWVTPEPPRRPLYERYGPLAAVLALVAVLCWSAWKATTPPPAGPPDLLVADTPPPPQGDVEPAKAAPADKTQAAPTAEPGKGQAEATPKPEAPAPPAETEKKELAMAKPEAPAPAANANSDLPAGAVGSVSASNGVILHHTSTEPGPSQWDRLATKTPLKDRERLLNLAPFRTQLTLGSAQVEMVGETEVWAHAANPMQAAVLTLSQGRVLLRGTTPAAPFDVKFSGRLISMTPPPGVVVGLERLNRRERGSTKPLAPILRIFVAEGEVPLVANDAKETLQGPASLTYDPSQGWTDRSSDPPPSWVSETTPPPFDVQVGEQFLSFFPQDRPVPTAIVEALDSDQKEIRQLAISALRAMGDVSFVVPLLSKEDSVTRRTALRVLRAYLAEGEDTVRTLHKELESYFGKDQGEKVEKLLVGYTEKEAKDPKTYEALVKLLESKDEGLVGVRELALDNLQTLTGRDDLGYDPAKPEGKGLKAWQDLKRDNELRPVGAPKAKK